MPKESTSFRHLIWFEDLRREDVAEVGGDCPAVGQLNVAVLQRIRHIKRTAGVQTVFAVVSAASGGDADAVSGGE